jgi:hypothetical protein
VRVADRAVPDLLTPFLERGEPGRPPSD